MSFFDYGNQRVRFFNLFICYFIFSCTNGLTVIVYEYFANNFNNDFFNILLFFVLMNLYKNTMLFFNYLEYEKEDYI